MNEHFDIEKFFSLEGYDTQTRKSRRKKSQENTQEFFTPLSIVKRMGDKIPEDDWSNPDKTFLEPCFGNGQFVCYIIYNRIVHGINWLTALKTTYGVELMQDNVAETKDRILSLLIQMNINFDKNIALKVINHNLVCSDFFNWDFKNWTKYGKPLF